MAVDVIRLAKTEQQKPTSAAANTEVQVDSVFNKKDPDTTTVAASRNKDAEFIHEGIIGLAKDLNISENELFEWINKYLGISESKIYSFSAEEFTGTIQNILEEITSYIQNVKSIIKKTNVSEKDIFKSLGEQCHELIKLGFSLQELSEKFDKRNLAFKERTKAAAQGKKNIKSATFLGILKAKNPGKLNLYDNLKEVPHDVLKECVRNLVKQAVQKFKDADADTLKKQTQIFKEVFANTPFEDAKILLQVVREEFGTDALKQSLDISLSRMNNENDSDFMDILINWIKKEGKELNLSDEDLNQVITKVQSFSNIPELTQSAKAFIEQFGKNLTEDEKIILNQINTKIQNYLKEHNISETKPENVKTPTIEDLKLTDEAQINVYNKLNDVIDKLVQINLAAINNKRFNTTEDQIQNFQNEINTSLSEYGISNDFYHIKTKEAIDNIIQNNPDFFDGLSKEEIYDALNKYTNNKFGESTGCYGNNTTSSSAGTASSGVGIEQSSSYIDYLNSLNKKKELQAIILNNVNEEPKFEIVEKTREISSATNPLCSDKSITKMSANELHKALSDPKKNFKFSDVVKQYKNLTKEGQDFVVGALEAKNDALKQFYLGMIRSNHIVAALIIDFDLDPDSLNIGLDYANRKKAERAQEEKGIVEYNK